MTRPGPVLPVAGADLSFEVVAPAGGTVEAIRAMPALGSFSVEAMSFLADLSSGLLKAPASRGFPELMALGYWMRPAALKRLADRYAAPTQSPTVLFAARGTAFHIAPSNVDTIFVYSWLVSLLAGNANVVRLSRKLSPQVEVLVGALTVVLNDPKHAAVRDRTLLVRYEPDPAVTRYFSSACDVRVVWGGDVTVGEIREIPLPPLATELVFGDRFSMAVVRADAWLEASAEVRQRAIHGFVNDAYWFMQMACSSPRLVVWIGEARAVERAREDFWTALRAEVVGQRIDFSARDYISKRVAAAGMAIEGEVRVEPEPTGDVARLWIGAPSLELRERHCGAGLFWESACESLDQLAPALERRLQTVAQFGYAEGELAEFLRRAHPRGGDRWVPFGRALDFDHIWDGYDLLRVFTRQVTVAE